MENNLKLWDLVSVTDKKYTKPAKKGAYQFTSITPMYQKMQATKALGPQGIGWGVEPESETFEYKEIGTTTLLVYRSVMFFVFGGEKGRIPIAASEKICYMTQGTNGYLKIDDEAHKKVKTSALTKGLSEIGVSADIHMNLHEDFEYQEYAAAKIRMDSGDVKEVEKAKLDFKEWFDKESSAINLATSERMIDTIYNRMFGVMSDRLIVLHADKTIRTSYENKLLNVVNKAKENLNKKG